MKRPAVAALLALLLTVTGCAGDGSAPPPSPGDGSPPPPAGQDAPAQPEPHAPEGVRLPAFPLDVVNARLRVDRQTVYLDPALYGARFRSAAEAFNEHREGTAPQGIQVPLYEVTLRAQTGEVLSLSVQDARTVRASYDGRVALITSPALVAALQPLRDVLLVFDDQQALKGIKANLGEGWSPHPAIPPAMTGWVNEAAGLALTVWQWQGLQLTPDGAWSLQLEYGPGRAREAAAVTVVGAAREYPAVRYRLAPESTGARVFTIPWALSVAGRQGAVTVQCEPWGPVRPETAEAIQRRLDEQCPALLERIAVGDLGEPIPPVFNPEVSIPEGEPAALLEEDGGFRLVFREDVLPEWLGERLPTRWQFRLQGRTAMPEDLTGEWLVDLTAKEVRPAQAPWLRGYFGRARPYALPDRRIVGAAGNNGPGTQAVTFVLQDPATEAVTELGKVTGGVVEIAPAGETALAYATYLSDQHLGALWQYDWQKGEHVQIAPQGWPVGLLANGQAVAHLGEAIGPLITWRSETPHAYRQLSPPGVEPYRATISPDGLYLVYFHAAPAQGSRRQWETVSDQAGSKPNPKVTHLAIYDVRREHTTANPLPLPGKVTDLRWQPDGSLIIQLQWEDSGGRRGTFFLHVTPPSVVRMLYASEETLWYGGRDGCAVLLYRGEDLYRYRPEGCGEPNPSRGLERLGDKRRMVRGHDLIGFPEANGLTVLDTRTGKRYRAPGLTVPGGGTAGTTVPGWVRMAPFRPESGWVGLVVQQEPQYAYRIVPVAPLGP